MVPAVVGRPHTTTASPNGKCSSATIVRGRSTTKPSPNGKYSEVREAFEYKKNPYFHSLTPPQKRQIGLRLLGLRWRIYLLTPCLCLTPLVAMALAA